MPNFDNLNHDFIVEDAIDNSVAPLSNSVALHPAQFFGANWPRILPKTFDLIENAQHTLPWDGLQIFGD
jgi:hypothetical protein